MRPLNILICGGNEPAMQQLAQLLEADDVNVQVSTHPIDNLCFSGQAWDFLLIDLDRLDSYLRTLLPAVRRKFPNLPMIGVSTKSAGDINPLSRYKLKLDAHFSEIPLPEDLLAHFPASVKYPGHGTLSSPDNFND